MTESVRSSLEEIRRLSSRFETNERNTRECATLATIFDLASDSLRTMHRHAPEVAQDPMLAAVRERVEWLESRAASMRAAGLPVRARDLLDAAAEFRLIIDKLDRHE